MSDTEQLKTTQNDDEAVCDVEHISSHHATC